MKSKLNRLLFIASFLVIFSSHADVLLRDTHGKSTLFSSLQGKWVIINYWAKWCPACLDEIPELNRFYTKHQKDAVAVYAFNYDDLPIYEQKDLIQRLQIKYPNLLRNPADELHLGDIIGLPATFIFNPQGQLVKRLYGEQSMRSLEKIISKG